MNAYCEQSEVKNNSVETGNSTVKNYNEISKTYIAFTSQDIFSNALLCNWDNIYGPKLQHIWTDKLETYSIKIFHFSARQMLSSQILQDPSKPNIEMKFYIWREKKIALVAALFGAQNTSEPSMHALIIFGNFEHLDKFLFLKRFFLNNIFHCAQELKIFLTVNKNKGFNSIRLKFENLLIVTRSLNLTFNLKPSIMFSLPNYSQSFLHNVLYCHLSQCCRTIVVAGSNNIDAINQMISFLSLFTLESQNLLQYVSSENINIYSPYLDVQGLIKTDKYMEQIMHQIYNAYLPTALIDIDTKQCFILCPLKEYFKKMKNFIFNNLQKIWNENYEEGLIENFFINVNVSQSLLLPFLNQMQLLLFDNNICKNFVISLIMLLRKKAISLIKNFETELKCSPGKAVSLLTLKKVEGLKLKQDFEIISSLTEIIKPGFMQFLFQNSIDK